jgi:DNA-binding response OmpR family regulator
MNKITMKHKKKTILVVDDEPSLSSALFDVFSREGYDVILAADGEQGLKSAKDNHPDIILLDIVMPVMDGSAMLDKLRQDKWGKQAKVIMLTNLSASKEEAVSLSKNVENYIIKSDWKIKDIVDLVNKKLGE